MTKYTPMWIDYLEYLKRNDDLWHILIKEIHMENEEIDFMSMWNVGADTEEIERTIVESMTRSLSE